MDKRKMSIAVVTAGAVSLVVIFATASSLMANTPFYTFRMEQQSSKLNFLPTAVNGVTYTAEKGYSLNYEVGGAAEYCGVSPLATSPASTCNPSCFESCGDTCLWTCFETCPTTCWTRS